MNPVIIIEGTAYRLRDDQRLETVAVGEVMAKFDISEPSTRNMTEDQDHRIKEALKMLGFLFPSGRKSPVSNKSMKGHVEKRVESKPRGHGKGVLSQYTCNVCQKSFASVDTEDGVTWPEIPCNQTHHCRGKMSASAYEGEAKPTYEWRMPTDDEVQIAINKGLPELPYYQQGGMVLEQISVTVET